MKRIFDFYINSSIHVALAVVSFVYITAHTQDLDISPSLYFLSFFSTIVGYNYVKYRGVKTIQQSNLIPLIRGIKVMTVLSLPPFLYLMGTLSKNGFAVVLLSGLLTFLYATPILYKKNVRAFATVKIFIVALVWTQVTVLLPVYESRTLVDDDIVITLIQRFIIVVVLIIPFDIRDIQNDAIELKTIPQLVGVTASKYIGICLLLLVFALEVGKDDTQNLYIKCLGIVCSVVVVLLLFTSKRRSKYYTSFIVEAVPISWAIGLLLF